MMKVYDDKGKKYEALKLPYARKTHCKAYEENGKCVYYAHCYNPGGHWWDSISICLHPGAQGNKGAWLTICPIYGIQTGEKAIEGEVINEKLS